VHLDSLACTAGFPELPPVPIACTHHDIECELLRRRAQHVDRPLLQRYLLFQADRVERVAREMCRTSPST